MAHKQPAQPLYFFQDGFSDLGHVIAGAFSYCKEGIVASAEGIGEAWGSFTDLYGFFKKIFGFLLFLLKFTFYLVRLISSAIVTPIVCFSLTIFQISILLTLFLIILIFIGIVISLDKIYCAINAIVSHCPVCQSKFSLPVYICPKCGARHDRLGPGIYGILYRKCNCGNKLPTIFFTGRHKLDAHCPHCNCNIKDGGLHASWCIPVVGGANSGKTCYINMAMMSLEKNSYKYGLRFEHEKNGLDGYEENSYKLSHGDLPFKTNDLRLTYYQFTLTSKNSTKQQISLCDVAGELFDITAGGKAIEQQTGFRYVNAFMLIIDPLSIPEYRSEVSKTTGNLDGYKGGTQHIDDMLDTFVRTLENLFRIDAKAIRDTDVAVVFTKADIPGLDQKIGESAVLKNAPGISQKSRYETQNKLCEKFLHEYNEDNFLNSLKSRFKSIQFFTCSALGHVMNGQPFIASNVEEPFFWLVGKRSKIIEKAIRKGGKK